MRVLKLSLTAALTVIVAVVVIACGGALGARIGGTISGLSSGNTVGLTLAINNTDMQTISVGYNSSDNTFEFDQTVESGQFYTVRVSTQPSGQFCQLANASGQIADNGSNVTNVEVTCQAGSTANIVLQASVAGLAQGAQLVLQDIVAGTLTITGTADSAAGKTITQNFPTSVSPNTLYSTIIKTQPTSPPFCDIKSGTESGTVTGSSTGTPPPFIGPQIICQRNQ